MTRDEQRSFDLVTIQPAPNCFIQWKGTDVCMDFRCTCGQHYHIDAEFAYALHCVKCDTLWEMPSILYPRKIASFDGIPIKLEIDEDGEGWAKR